MSCQLAYFTVYEDNNMVERVPKTWKERLCWKFWVTHKIIPMKTFIVIDAERAIFCHPSMKEALEDHIESLI